MPDYMILLRLDFIIVNIKNVVNYFKNIKLKILLLHKVHMSLILFGRK